MTGERSEQMRRRVLAVVRLVPPGRAVSYGDLAELLGIGPRQVGRVMAAGPAPGEPPVPWWRVTNGRGALPAHLLTEAIAAWRVEGTGLVADGTRVDLRTQRACLPLLADAAEELLGPLPGASE